MGRKGLAARTLTFLVVVAMALPAPMLVDTADGAGPPDITGSQPPASGDWEINETTVVRGQDLDLACDITVRAPHSLTIIGSNISVDRSGPRTHLLKVESNASLVIEGSSLDLSELEADVHADVTMANSTIATSGRFLAGCARLRAYGCTILNTAPDGSSDRHGGDAVLDLGGGVGSEVRDCTVVNRGGDAGPRSIVAYGMAGGTARLVSNATSWVNCTVEDIAGSSEDGGPDINIIDDPGGYTGGAGGAGGLAECIIQARRIERMDLTVQASSGGDGAKGGDCLDYDAGDGGDGGRGGDAIVRITGGSALDLVGSRLRASADWGGSGGPGGQSTMGKGGDAGQAGIAGSVEVVVSAAMDLTIDDAAMMLAGGMGGWGGDYGRSEVGAQGETAPGSGGGSAALEVVCGGDMVLRRVSLNLSGGAGMDGGGGYDHGGNGGDGGSAVLRVRTDDRIDAEDIVLAAHGGTGGNGGPASSNINGNGGDGGNATVELNGTQGMQVRRFTFDIKGGGGGKGNNPIWDGEGGVPNLVIVTHRLEMWNGTLGWRLDALPDDAETDLYDVKMDFFYDLELMLPPGNGIIRTWYTVEIMVVDSWNPATAKPRVNFSVDITSISTGAMVFTRRTNADGIVSTCLQSFLYKPTGAEYVGGYLVTAIRPDGKMSRTVRIDVQGPIVRPDQFIIVLPNPTWPPYLFIETPSSGKTYTFTYDNATMEIQGYSTDIDEYVLQSISVRLSADGRPADYWPTYSLSRSAIPLSEVKDPNDRWGKYFPPEANQNKCRFFMRYTIVHGPVYMPSGDYLLTVTGSDGNRTWNASVELYLYVLDNSPPNVTLATDLDRVDWNSTSPVVLSGTSADDHGEQRVEVRLDDGAWEVANGTYSWTFRLNLASIPEGFHTIEVRASDGEFVSPTIAHTFTIDRPEAPRVDPIRNNWTYMAVALTALVALGLLWLALALLKRRARPGA